MKGLLPKCTDLMCLWRVLFRVKDLSQELQGKRCFVLHSSLAIFPLFLLWQSRDGFLLSSESIRNVKNVHRYLENDLIYRALSINMD